MRDIIFENLPPQEWIDAYEAGVWTEFMEQRAPGHTAGGERIFKMGVLDIKEEIRRKMEELDPSDPEYYEKMEELKAMDIVADAILIYARRYAEKLEKMAEEETDPKRKEELKQMAEICRWVPAHPPPEPSGRPYSTTGSYTWESPMRPTRGTHSTPPAGWTSTSTPPSTRRT